MRDLKHWEIALLMAEASRRLTEILMDGLSLNALNQVNNQIELITTYQNALIVLSQQGEKHGFKS